MLPISIKDSIPLYRSFHVLKCQGIIIKALAIPSRRPRKNQYSTGSRVILNFSRFERIPSTSQRTIKTPFSVIGSPPGIIFCASRALAGAFCCDLERPRLQRGAAVTACTPAAPVISNGEKLHFFRVSGVWIAPQ